MSRRASLLVLVLVVVLLSATAGCIEVKDKPPQGEFTVSLVTEEIFFVDDSGGTLQGPHAEVETHIPHAHTEYAWDIEGLGEFEGADAELPAHSQGVRLASFDVHFIDQSNHTGVAVATVPDLSGIYMVFADGTSLDPEANVSDHPVFDLEWGDDLHEVHEGEEGFIREYTGRLSEPMTLNVSLNESSVGSGVYLLGFHVRSGDLLVERTASVRISPGEEHWLSYQDGELQVRIPHSDQQTVIYDGPYEGLPKEYRTEIGTLEWEGWVGEPEETPGPGALAAVVALSAVAGLVVRGRRRRR